MGYFEKNSRVRKLDLSHNNLTKIEPHGFFGIDGLHSLNMNNNLFTEVPAEVNGNIVEQKLIKIFYDLENYFHISVRISEWKIHRPLMPG